MKTLKGIISANAISGITYEKNGGEELIDISMFIDMLSDLSYETIYCLDTKANRKLIEKAGY